MIVLDTNALIFDALAPQRLTAKAKAAIENGTQGGCLAIADITLWEIAQLVRKNRLELGMDTQQFLADAVVMRRIRVVAISGAIAALAGRLPLEGDPADRLIVATTQWLGGQLVTADARIQACALVPTIWQ